MRTKHFILGMMLAGGLLASCDSHKDYPDTSVKAGHVLCTDGALIDPSELSASGKEAVGVVFYVNQDPDKTALGKGLAVYLHDMPPAAFSNNLGKAQGTSASLTDFDGNANTYAMYTNDTVPSPLAAQVFDMWSYRQSAYIPSVAQMSLLFRNRALVNEVLRQIGGDPLPGEDEDCWYWTSTEVKGQEAHKSWLFSLATGAYQETPKNQEHPTRPIITLNE